MERKKELRTENTKVFEDEEGTQKTLLYMGAIHYLDKDNTWQEYNTDLKSSRSRSSVVAYHQTASDVDVNIPATITEEMPITMKVENSNLSISKKELLQNPKVNKNTLMYSNDNQQISVKTIGPGIQISEHFTEALPSQISYTYAVDKGNQLLTDETKSSVQLVDSSQVVLATITAPKVIDVNGQPYNNATIESIPLTNDSYTIQISLPTTKANPPSYPVDVVTTTATLAKGSIPVYGINNRKPDATYGPGHATYPRDMFLVGDSPYVDYFPLGLFKAFASTNVSNWKDYIGKDRTITDANLHIFEYTSSSAPYAESSEIKAYRIEQDYQGRPSNVTWNSWIGSSSNVSIVSATWATRYVDNFVNVDISEAVNDWYNGAPDYGIMLDTTRDNEGLIFLNHDSSNISIGGKWGNLDGRPYIEVTHKKAAPVANDLPLNDVTLTMRPFTSSQQGGLLKFQAIGFDGVTRPGTMVDVEVYEANNPNTIVYNSNTMALTGYRQFPYYEPPVYPAIDKAQKYYGLASNYQLGELLYSKNLKKNVLYQVRVRAKSLRDDGSIKETGKWVIGDTFQVYTVKGFDHLPRLISFYGLASKTILMKDNHMRDELIVENNEIIIRNPKVNQGKAYIGQALSENDKKNIDGYLMGQGKHCEYGYEPVNFNTGNFYYQNKDTSFVDYGTEIAMERHYNSMANGTESIFGRNWDFIYNKQLSFLSNGDVFYFDGTGKRIKFTKQSNQSYVVQGGEPLTLTKKQVGSTSYTEESGYYDTVDEAPKTTTTSIPVFQYTITDNKGMVNTFKTSGMIESIKLDRYNHYLRFVYDNSDKLTKITTPSNKNIIFDYTANGYVSKITLPDGNTLQYSYDSKGNLTTFKDQLGYTVTYRYEDTKAPYAMTSYVSRDNKSIIIKNTYDTNGRVIKQVDAKGDSVQFKYYSNRTEITGFDNEKQIIYLDSQKRTTKIVHSDGSIQEQSYDNNNNLITQKNTNQEQMKYQYDSRGNLIKEIRIDGKTKTYTYNSLDLPISIIEYDGTVVTSDYDSYGNQTAVHYPDGTSKTYAYDGHGQLVKEVNRNGNIKTYTYVNGNKITETDSFGTKKYTYDAMGRMNIETDASGNTTSYTRNGRGELLAIIRPNGTQEYMYDVDGQKIWEKDPNGNEKIYMYDSWSRVIEEHDGYGIKKYEYDSRGNVIKFIDELNHSTTYVYDQMNRKVETIYPDGNKESYMYDERGRLIEVIDVLNNRKTMEYEDTLNLVTKMTDEEGNVTTFAYDLFGNVTKINYADQTSESFIYNNEGKVIESSNRQGTKTKYRYDSNGNTLEISTNDRSVKSEYGKEDVLLANIDALNQKETLSYTATKLIDTVTMKNGSTLQYQYDGQYNITKITDSNGNSTSKTYDGNGNVTSETDANNHTIQYTYTSRNQIATITYPDGGVIQYVYDACGNQIEIIDQLGNTTKKKYDEMNRMVEETDARGNITTKEYDAKGRVVKSIDPLKQETTYTYDKVGNLIEQQDPGGVITTYQYNSSNQIIKVQDNFDHFVEYSYDDLGNIIKQVNWKNEVVENTYDEFGNLLTTTDFRGNTTTYQYDVNNQVVQSKDAKGNIITYTRNSIGQPTTTIDGTMITKDTYNNVGLLTQSSDQDNNETIFTYDASGNMTSITVATGIVEMRTYTPTNLVASITDPNGGVTSNEYDVKGQLIAKTDPEGNKTQYQYDENGNLILEVDPLGYGTKYKYDELNRVIEITDKNDNSISYTYNQRGQQITQSSFLGTTENIYDEKGLLIETIDYSGKSTTYSYDEFERLETKSDTNGFEETYSYNQYGDILEITNNQDKDATTKNTYDTFGQLIEKTDAIGNKTTYEYTSLGKMHKIIMSNGNSISYTYDSYNRLKTMQDIRGNLTEYQYDVLGQVTAIKYPGDKEYSYTYDKNGNLLSEVNPMKATTTYAYNKNNQLVSTTNALGVETKAIYDSRGYVSSTIDGKGNTIMYQYDPNGNVVEQVDANNNSIKYQYDEGNRVITIRDREDVETSYQYDASNNVTKRTDGNGNDTEFVYDSNNQLIEVSNGKGNVEKYKYDLKGNVTEETKPDGRSITSKYDALNNLIYQGYDDKNYQYTYNEDNQLVSVKDNKTKSSMEYNKYGDLISYRDSHDNVVKYEYDELGRKTGIIYPDNSKVEYRYDSMDHLIEIQKGEDITRYQYDALGNKVETLLPNQTRITYEYDENSQLIKQVSYSNNQTVLSSYQYVYDALGNVIEIEQSINDKKTYKEYTYDNEEKILSSKITTDDKVEEYVYSYDRTGNKVSLEKKVNGKKENIQYSFDKSNALIEQIGSENIEYTYDKNGNVIERAYENGVVETFSYDTKGQLLKVISSTGKTITYQYDGLGNRIEKQEVTSIEYSKDSKYLEFQNENILNEDYDQSLMIQTTEEKLKNLQEEIEEHNQDIFTPICNSKLSDDKKESVKTIYYVLDINKEYPKVLQTTNDDKEILDTYIYGSQRISQEDENESRYYSYDGNGNVVGQITNSNLEKISFPVSYSDYGKASRKMDDSFGYNGELHDYNNSQYLRARQYDTSSGTFMQEDSYLGETNNPISQNRYAYVHNNPINLKDPSGHYIAFDDPDDDAISRVINAQQKTTPSKKVTWDNGVDRYFAGRNNQKAAYQKKAEEKAREAEKYNREQIKLEEKNKAYINDIASKKGNLGLITQMSFETYRGQGYSVEDAYFMALKTEKICSKLKNDQLGDIVDKLNNMKIRGEDLGELFKWRTETLPGRYQDGTQVHDFEYSYFMNIVNETKSMADSMATWLDDNLDDIAAILGGIALVAGVIGSAIVSIPLAIGGVTCAAIGGFLGTTAMVSAGLGAFASGAQFISGLSGYGLDGDKLSSEHAKYRINAGVVNMFNSLLGALNGLNAKYESDKAQGSGNDKIPWDTWENYEKVTVDGRQYAKVGNRLYSHHAVDRMQPSGNRYGSSIYQAGGDSGRSVAPQYVEDAIASAKPVVQANGNLSYTSGTLQVITNPEGAVVTIITH